MLAAWYQQTTATDCAYRSTTRGMCGMVSCHARLVEVRPDTGPAGGATVHLSAAEVRALWNVLGLVAAGGSLTDKPEREMARRLQTELEAALGD